MLLNNRHFFYAIVIHKLEQNTNVYKKKRNKQTPPKSDFDYFQNKPLIGKQLDSYVKVWKTGSYFLLIF